MGVNISELVTFEPIEMESLTGRALAIDALNMIYQFLGNIRQADGTPLMDSQGNITSHLSGLFYRTSNLISKSLKPIYVFDGAPPDFKAIELEKRREIRAAAKEKWDTALREGRLDDAKRHAQASAKVTQEMVDESKLLLKAMGVPTIQAKSEGEAQCARICMDGKAFATVSQDFDSLLFGSPRTLRNLSIAKSETLQIVELSAQRLSREEMILIGILVGTDYNVGGVNGLGPKKALALVEKHKTLEEIKKQVEWKFDIEMETLFEFFMNPPVEKDYSINFGRPNREKIIEILCEKRDFSKERVKNTLDKLEEKKGTQTSLMGF
jgi:flap endonuclease-1